MRGRGCSWRDTPRCRSRSGPRRRSGRAAWDARAAGGRGRPRPDGALTTKRPARRKLAGRSGHHDPREDAIVTPDSVRLLALIVGIVAFGATMLALGLTIGLAL